MLIVMGAAGLYIYICHIWQGINGFRAEYSSIVIEGVVIGNIHISLLIPTGIYKCFVLHHCFRNSVSVYTLRAVFK